jgi:hypothetical protein
MSGAIPPLPNMPSWRGAQLKHRDNFTFPFTIQSYAIYTVETASSNSPFPVFSINVTTLI